MMMDQVYLTLQNYDMMLTKQLKHYKNYAIVENDLSGLWRLK